MQQLLLCFNVHCDGACLHNCVATKLFGKTLALKGLELEKLTWKQAEQALHRKTIVVIPLGAAAKEHGYHLPLNIDALTATYFKNQLLLLADVVVAPTITYSFYPAFSEYPGSISLTRQTAAAMVHEICLSLSAFGPRKFYVLNHGVSTLRPLRDAAEILAQRGILLTFTDLQEAFAKLPDGLCEQEGGSHADEVETSMMLAIAPEIVCMDLASKDFDKLASGRLSRSQLAGTSYSESGVWGDATLASPDKGNKIVECLLAHLLEDIDRLAQAPLPPVTDSNATDPAS